MSLYEALGNAAINEENKEGLKKLVLKSESFIDDVLHQQLRERQKKRDEIVQDIFDMLAEKIEKCILRMLWKKLHNGSCTILENLKLFLNMKDQKEIETLTSLGCDSYAYADILDKNKIFIQIGYEFYLEMTLEDAIVFLKKKINLYEDKLSYWNKQIARIKAHIQIVTNTTKIINEGPLKLSMKSLPKRYFPK
ncbi:prefoldin, putative [Plasmodium ovale curtisi]|uniref:Prefoldin, putative n=1 Tax=Plasmodium ovale curtisi TaxID=864141 RepID=A0A1A8VVH5_PLAOA|nr:prefoldin, putative [Plasmodium ovale curtisi]SBS90431.1 prefoldin, putative [Plasmodium ovale curtisi]